MAWRKQTGVAVRTQEEVERDERKALEAMVDIHLRTDEVAHDYVRSSFTVHASDQLAMFTASPVLTEGLVCTYLAEVEGYVREERFERAANVMWLVRLLRRMAKLNPDEL